jgi:metal-dependent hydrolase (beta-lactamase superfamily II)
MLLAVRLFFISHMHADHHVGLCSLLSAKQQVCPNTAAIATSLLNCSLAHFGVCKGTRRSIGTARVGSAVATVLLA